MSQEIDVKGRCRRLGATEEERMAELLRIVGEAYRDARAFAENGGLGDAAPFVWAAHDHLANARERLARGRQAL